MFFILYSYWLHISACQKCIFIYIQFIQCSLNILKLHQQEISSIGRNVFEYFCVSLYKDYLSNRQKIFYVASECNINLDHQIWSFRYSLFLSYSDNTHTKQPLKMWFSNSRTSKHVKPSKSQFWRFSPKVMLFLPYTGKRK